VVGVILSQSTTTMGGHTFTSENGFRTGLLVGCGIALVAAVIAAVIPAARPDASDAVPDDTGADPASGTGPEQAAVRA
jgi:hypothetical protein